MNAPTPILRQQRQPLPDAWVRKLFAELHGNYGSRWLSMWATGEKLEDGSDAGMAVAMRVWAGKLSGFSDRPDAIKRVLANLPVEVPTLPKFLELCRESARVPSGALALENKPTAEQWARSREAAKRIADLVRRMSVEPRA